MRALWLGASCAIVCHLAAASAHADNEKTKKKFPTLAQVNLAAQELFRDEWRYREGEIISQSQVERLFKELAGMGWTVPEQQELLDEVLPDDDFLVRQMRTRDGRKFALQIAQYPGSMDRLDRLARMPTGHSAVSRLIKGPDGYKMLQYMTTSAGGTNMGRMLSNTPTGRDFNKPTGRIYVLSELLAVLEQRYEASARLQAAQ